MWPNATSHDTVSGLETDSSPDIAADVGCSVINRGYCGRCQLAAVSHWILFLFLTGNATLLCPSSKLCNVKQHCLLFHPLLRLVFCFQLSHQLPIFSFIRSFYVSVFSYLIYLPSNSLASIRHPFIFRNLTCFHYFDLCCVYFIFIIFYFKCVGGRQQRNREFHTHLCSSSTCPETI